MKSKITSIVFTLLLVSAMVASAAVRYVTPDGTGTASGATSWAAASHDLQAVIFASAPGDEVWVAAGTYLSSQANKAFAMREGIKIYGGFTGTESNLNQRNWAANATVLKGDGYRVIENIGTQAVPLTSAMVLDGFTITEGVGPAAGGGGMFNQWASPTITNCIFTANKAGNNGAAINNSHDSHAKISNCTFINNSLTGTGGGAIINQVRSSPVITNCKFINNKAGGMYGGAIFNYSGWGNVAAPEITNCLFVGNSAGIGGAIANAAGSEAGSKMTVKITNCTFYGNEARTKGGAIYNERPEKCEVTVQNTLVIGNIAPEGFFPGIGKDADLVDVIKYSLVQGMDADADYIQEGSHNVLVGSTVAADLFKDIANQDFSSKNTSIAVNKGSNALNTLSTDLAGNPRIYQNTIDIGAYELQEPLVATSSGVLKMNLGVYPNPAMDVLRIHGVKGCGNVQVFDNSGRIVLYVKSQDGAIDVSNLNNGIYSIRLTDEEGVRSARFIKN